MERAEGEGEWEEERERKGGKEKKRIGIGTKGKVKEEKGEGKTHMTIVRDPLVPLIDFVYQAIGEKYNGGEKWEPWEAHPKSINLKICIILRFNFFTVNH